VFDSGLGAILDVLDLANAMADQVPEAPSWHAACNPRSVPVLGIW
jgi:hypothetical protein